MYAFGRISDECDGSAFHFAEVWVQSFVVAHEGESILGLVLSYGVPEVYRGLERVFPFQVDVQFFVCDDESWM